MKNKDYIGDGVYVEFDGFGLWLTTERMEGEHRIYLEPSVFNALCGFWKRMEESSHQQTHEPE